MQTNHTQAFDAFKTHTHSWIYTVSTYRRLDKYSGEEFAKCDEGVATRVMKRIIPIWKARDRIFTIFDGPKQI